MMSTIERTAKTIPATAPFERPSSDEVSIGTTDEVDVVSETDEVSVGTTDEVGVVSEIKKTNQLVN